MDSFTIGVIIKALLASAGLKATLAILVVGGFLFACYKSVTSVAGFFREMLASRDAMLSQTLRDIAVYQRETAAIFAAIKADTANQLAEARDTRKEMHQRFNKLQEDVTTIRGATS